MITIDLGTIEEYDGDTNQFIYHEGGKVRFEYSLKAIYDWESKWRKPFLNANLSDEEWIDFYKTMALDPLPQEFIRYELIKQLSEYITTPDTATIFTSEHEKSNKVNNKKGKFHTAEELYATMIGAGVPLEFENRNLNRLLITLRIISIQNEEPKKMTKQDVMKQNSSLNEQRKAMLKTRG